MESRSTACTRTNNHDWPESIYNPAEIHLQYLPDAVLLARAWHRNRPFGRRRAATRFYLGPCRTSAHRPRITGSRPRSKSRSCTTKLQLQTSERILHTGRRTALAKTTPSSSSRICPSGVMSKSGKGSQENHGKNVKQKSGLNEETLRNSLPSGPSGRGGCQEMEMAENAGRALQCVSRLIPPAPAVDRSRRYTRILLIVFLCTHPLVNPIHAHSGSPKATRNRAKEALGRSDVCCEWRTFLNNSADHRTPQLSLGSRLLNVRGVFCLKCRRYSSHRPCPASGFFSRSGPECRVTPYHAKSS